jgi:hypothetical protein
VIILIMQLSSFDHPITGSPDALITGHPMWGYLVLAAWRLLSRAKSFRTPKVIIESSFQFQVSGFQFQNRELRTENFFVLPVLGQQASKYFKNWKAIKMIMHLYFLVSRCPDRPCFWKLDTGNSLPGAKFFKTRKVIILITQLSSSDHPVTRCWGTCCLRLLSSAKSFRTSKVIIAIMQLSSFDHPITRSPDHRML